MDQEDEKVLYLSRVGRNKIFKYGTYTMVKERAITQDHPFYAERTDDASMRSPMAEMAEMQRMAGEATQAAPEPAAIKSAPQEPAPAAPDPDPAALAGQIISSNFKVGLSQEEVDALLNGMS